MSPLECLPQLGMGPKLASMKAKLALFGILALGSLPSNSLSAPYHPTQDSLGARIHQLVAKSKGMARMVLIGKSRGGLPIHGIELKRGKGENRPALLLVAGLDGRRSDDSDVALDVVKDFITAKPNSPEERVLKNATIWVIPCANPDGRAAGVEGNLGPVDEDRDGRIDEDGPEDLNGDGIVLWMRKKDPEGAYIQDKKTGLMRKADPKQGEAGVYKLWREGIDNDKDGDFNEDPKGGIIPNRNFPHLYPEHGKGAGPYVLSEPEALSLVDFVIGNPRIQMVLTLGAFDNLGTKAKSNTASTKQPINGYLTRDKGVLERFAKAIGRKGRHGTDDWKGHFHAWVYAHAGRISLALNLSTKKKTASKKESNNGPSSKPSKKSREEQSGEVASSKRKTKGNSDKAKFPKWKPFNHPQLGAIEIGGKDPREDCKLSHEEQRLGVPLVTKLLVAGVEGACQLRIVKLETKALGEGAIEVRAVVRNNGKSPSRTAVADRLGNPRLPRLEFVRFSQENPRASVRWGKKEGQETLLIGKPFVFIPSKLLLGQTAEFRWVLKKPEPGTVGLRIAQEGMVFDVKEVK